MDPQMYRTRACQRECTAKEPEMGTNVPQLSLLDSTFKKTLNNQNGYNCAEVLLRAQARYSQGTYIYIYEK